MATTIKGTNLIAGGNPVTKPIAQTFVFPKALTKRSSLQTGRTNPIGLAPSSTVFFGGVAQETPDRGTAFLPRKLHGVRGKRAPEGFSEGGGTVGSGSGSSGGAGVGASGGGSGLGGLGGHHGLVP